MINDKFTIVHVVESFAGGVFDFITCLTQEMKEYHHVIIYGIREYTPENLNKYCSENVSLVQWPYATREFSLKKDVLALYYLFHLLKKYPRAIYHLHSSKAGFLGRIVARLLSKSHQTIYTPHGISFLRTDISFYKRTFYIFLEKIGAFFGGTIVACSASEHKAIEKEKIQCLMITNGVIQPVLKVKKNSKIIIGTCGRISYQKNPLLFNEIAKYYQNNSSINFVWIGDGEFKHMLTSPNIRSTGWLNKQEVECEISQFSIYLSTSSWEGLSLSTISAMGLRKPLILSHCIGNIDLIIDTYNGYIFDSFEDCIDKINNLLTYPQKLFILGNNSFDLYLKNFTLNQMIRSYQKLYEFCM